VFRCVSVGIELEDHGKQMEEEDWNPETKSKHKRAARTGTTRTGFLESRELRTNSTMLVLVLRCPGSLELVLTCWYWFYHQQKA
ncbi:unnamed protein product, partial [Ilex paraguariensis]